MIRFKVINGRLEVHVAGQPVYTTTVSALVDAVQAIQRGRTEVVL